MFPLSNNHQDTPLAYGVNLHAVVNSSLPAIVRLTALQRIHSTEQYVKPGEWLRDLPTYDLHFLIDLAERAVNRLPEEPLDLEFDALVLLTAILMQGEGVPFDDHSLQPHIQAFIQFLVMEALARRGMIVVTHQNISFGDDAGKLEIARAIVDRVLDENYPTEPPPSEE